jgi:hypothetical protein
MPRSLGVNNDDVVVFFAHFPTQFANGQNFFHARRGAGYKVEHFCQWADAGNQWDANKKPNVLAQ